jgi:hypothetical protein
LQVPDTGADTGQADPALVAALESGDPARILPLLKDARLLVAVIAIPGEDHASEGEMALALLESAGGEQALPVFTSLAAMSSWSDEARPVPRPAAEIVAYALAESLQAVVIDPGAAHSWTLWRDAFAESEPDPEPDPDPAENAYAPPSWQPSRKARKAAAPYEVFAVDAPAGTPAIAVICPDGTLDAGWARRLLAVCPSGTGVIALPPEAREAVSRVGERLAKAGLFSRLDADRDRAVP